ncbi:MAG: Trk system potassium transporter TrkA [Clostridia bacterium]|nr:Trk system potassium transporter TrkA [Clostridia bacterium]
MNIIIVGCGQVGRALAEQLCEKDNNITVIDENAENVARVTDKLDVMGVIGNGASHNTQKEAGVSKADLLIAVTGSDELNLLCCIIAKKASSCQTIARVRSHEYSLETSFLKDELELAMVINPERAAAEEMARVLRFPSALSVEPFSKGRVELIKIRLPESSKLVGMSVRDVASKYKADILFCTVERGDDAYITKGDLVFEAKDVVSIMATPQNAQEFLRKIGYRTQAVKSVMIVGGGEITHYLCSILKKNRMNITVIEKDREMCDRLSLDFTNVTVIHAGAAYQEIMHEEGIESVGAFIALTDLDEENILLSLFARSKTDNKVITRIKRIDYDSIMQRLELDTVIYPKNVTADTIARYIRSAKNTRGSNMENFHNLIKGKVEASEFIVRAHSKIIGKPLSELRLKDNVLISAIIRAGNVIMPRGYDTIEEGDSVIVVSGVMGLHDITDILA